MADGESGLRHPGGPEFAPFTMAFQPIVNASDRTVFAYEALVRGVNQEGAGEVLGRVAGAQRYAFDQACRAKAITLAMKLGLAQTGARLSVNFLPGAIAEPESCLKLTIRTAIEIGFPLERLIFEVAEHEEVGDPETLLRIADEYRRQGLRLALDDFGAGFAGLNLLSDGVAEIIKLDLHLIRDLEKRPLAQALIRSLAETCRGFGILVIAEGVETVPEYHTLLECGITLMQGYLFARPMFEGLPTCWFPTAQVEETGLGCSLEPARDCAGDRELQPLDAPIWHYESVGPC